MLSRLQRELSGGEASPIATLLGARLVGAAPGETRYELEVDGLFANPMGTLQSGILCDLAMGSGYVSLLAEGESFTTPQAIGVMTMAPVAGRIYGRVGPRRMAVAGLSPAGMAMHGFLRVDLQTNEGWIRVLMLLRGWGFALSLTALPAATFARVSPSSMGRGSAIYSVTRQVSTSLTVAVLATVLAGGLRRQSAMLGDPQTQVGALVAAVPALFVDDRLAAGTMHRGRQESAPANATLSAAGSPSYAERALPGPARAG